jgi:hypothetical protein
MKRATRITWHDCAVEAKPKTAGWFLLLTNEGEYKVDRYVPGSQWITMLPIVAWAKLPMPSE